jgi:HPt (histidine-containing phosphotransfer) domain-containing protein
VIELDKLMDRTGGDMELLCDIIEIFVDLDCESRLHDIREALESRNAEALHRAAHAFKGSVANFEAPPAFEAAKLVDALAREGKVEEAATAFVELERIAAELCAELNALRAQAAEQLGTVTYSDE